jgi:hypothetical protein
LEANLIERAADAIGARWRDTVLQVAVDIRRTRRGGVRRRCTMFVQPGEIGHSTATRLRDAMVAGKPRG